MIGLKCESGNFEDCMVGITKIPQNDCEGVLIFANFTSSCGSQCGSFSSETDFRNTENPKRSGWTNYIRFANIIIKPYKIKI